VALDDLLMLLHSSGTTGLPKGAMFTHGTALFSSMAKTIDFALTPRDACVVFGPLFHVGPLMDLALPLLLLGGKLVIGASGQFDAERLLATIARERATVVPVYPAMLRRLLAVREIDGYDLASWRLLITGGEPVPIPVLRGMYERLPEVGLVNNYGSTEGGPITTFLDPADKLRKIGSVGKPAFGVEVRIAGEDGRELPPGRVGELRVRSPFVCRGYWNRPDLTAASLREGWWHTGDLGWRDEDGFIWISGRLKDMIKSGTENIYPVEVEQVIASLEGVAETAVVGIPDEQWGEAVAAFVVRTPGSSLDAATVIEHCRQQLAGYKKPRHVVFVDSLPRNTTNKVSKAALRAALPILRPS
jgi:fatty-acyl-CoA synthase